MSAVLKTVVLLLLLTIASTAPVESESNEVAKEQRFMRHILRIFSLLKQTNKQDYESLDTVAELQASNQIADREEALMSKLMEFRDLLRQVKINRWG